LTDLNKNVITSTSGSNSPAQQQSTTTTVDGSGDVTNNKEWTKFTESPTSNVSSPGGGPKPVNVTQAIVSDPSHVIHPVPLRVTPVGTEIAEEEALRTFRKADTLVYESGVIKAQNIIVERDESSPKLQQQFKKQPSYQRDSLPNDLRAIQRPHPKKPASKNIGQIPLPPAAETLNHTNNQVTVTGASGNAIVLTNKKEVPPLPPPR
jgi:RalBP1-associated Eps domain-containing protein